MESQEDAHPSLLRDRRHVRRDPRRVDGEVHRLARAEEDALAEAVARPAGRGEVDGEVGDGRVLRGDGTADDALDPDVGGEVSVRAFEQLEAEIQLGLGHTLAEKIVDAIGHAAAPPGRQSRVATRLGQLSRSEDTLRFGSFPMSHLIA